MPGPWGEPLNALTNLAFLAAAIMVWRRAGRRPWARWLAGLLGLIFAASSAFHVLATGLTGAGDMLAILVFVLYYVVVFTHVFLGVRWARAWLAAPVFLVFTVAVTAAFAPLGFSGASYLPPLIGLFGLAGVLAASRDRYWPVFALTGVLFGLSLTLRTVDGVVCAVFPVGTHFLWHLLNACVLYLVSIAAIRKAEG